MMKRGEATTLGILIASLVVVVVAFGIYFFVGGKLTGYEVQGPGSINVIVYEGGTTMVVTGASVTLVSKDTGASVTGVFDKGSYLFTSVPIGEYTLKVSAIGYSVYSQSGIEIRTGANSDITAYLTKSTTSSPSLWKFNELSWTTDAVGGVKDSIGGKDGTAKGGADTIAQGVGGRAGNFDGVDDYVDVPGFSWASGGNVTVMFWLRAPSAGLKESAVFGVGSDNTNRFAAYLWYDKKLHWDYGWVNAGRISVDMTPYLDKWVHVALVSEGNNGKFKGIYINGQKAAEEANSDGADVVLSGLSIGRGFEGTIPRYVKGLIDEVNITNKVASADEIKAVYARERRNLVSAGGLGLVSQWSFQEAVTGDAGAVKDSLGALHGTAKNDVASVGEGIGGKAARFDGVDDEVIIPNAAVLSPTSALTVSGWFKTMNLTAGDVTTSWVSKRDAFVFGAWKDGHVSFFAFLNGVYQEVKTNDTVKVKEGIWQHWVATYDGGALTLYLNGTQVAKQTVSGTLGTSGDLYLGHDYVASAPTLKRFFNGMMDEVQVYDKALTADEVKALHTTQLAGFVAPAALPKTLSACARVSEAGTYTLTVDVKKDSGTCMSIEASNVVLEGGEHLIEGTSVYPIFGAEIGIAVKGQNVTVNDVRVEGFGIGILLQNVTGAKLSRVKVSKNVHQGLYLNWTNGSLLTNSMFDNNLGTGVLFARSGGNDIRDSTFRSNQGYGVFFADKSAKNKLEQVVFLNNSRDDVYSDESSKDNIVTRRAPREEPTTQQVIQPEKLRGAGYTKSMSVGESLLFKVNATTHNLTVDSFANNQLKITIRSHPQNFTMRQGEAQKVDLDHNKVYDLSVTFVSAVPGQPKLTLQAISEKIVEPPGGGGLFPGRDNGTGGARGNATKNETGTGGGWDQTTWIVVIAVLVVFIVVVIIAIVVALRNRGLSTQEQRFYRPEPHSSVLQPSSGFGGPNFGGP